MLAACRLDDPFDREQAPHGDSRFGAAVRGKLADFADAWGDIAPVTFAVAAWRVATSLEPPLVRYHRRVTAVRCQRSAWDGGLTCAATIAGPWPGELTWTRAWARDRGWRGWPEVFGQYLMPTDRDVARAPHLRALLLVEAPIPVDRLPPAPEHRDDDVERAARRAVVAVARELSDLLDPLLAQLDAGVPATPTAARSPRG